MYKHFFGDVKMNAEYEYLNIATLFDKNEMQVLTVEKLNSLYRAQGGNTAGGRVNEMVARLTSQGMVVEYGDGYARAEDVRYLDAQKSGKKLMKRADFDKLSPKAKTDFFNLGGLLR
jgi:hypothetical protein